MDTVTAEDATTVGHVFGAVRACRHQQPLSCFAAGTRNETPSLRTGKKWHDSSAAMSSTGMLDPRGEAEE